MFLITSAAYITPDLITEFGKIPPSFLPLQHKRLIEFQKELAFHDDKIFLTLPASYKLKQYDLVKLTSNQINIVLVPDNFSLGQSVIYSLNVIASFNEPVKILHGDTLFKKVPNDLDVYLVGQTTDNYNWASSSDFKENDYVYAGFFSFSNQSLLIKSITESKFEFINGIRKYKEIKNVIDQIAEGWLDFGHINTFYRSKTTLTTERYFNNLAINIHSVTKTSSNNNKIIAEINWYNEIPKRLKKYVPTIWDFGTESNNAYYQIEYLYLSTLTDLFLFGENKLFVWKKILDACNEFLYECLACPKDSFEGDRTIFDNLYLDKTISRLTEYSKDSNLDLNRPWLVNGINIPSLKEILIEVNNMITPVEQEFITVSHGDFGFSNILYDFRKQSIKVIDPRGIDSKNNLTIFGDIRYDIAKLAHSVIGLYDFIIAEKFLYNEKTAYDIEFKIYTDSSIKEIQQYFTTQLFGGLSLEDACTYPIMIDLFLSMLPLHKDNPLRQKALLANAFRLYINLKL